LRSVIAATGARRTGGTTARRALVVVATVCVLAAGVAVGLEVWIHTRHGRATAPPRVTVRRVRPHRRARPRPVPRLALPTPLPQRTIAVPILMYHRIGTDSTTTPLITRALTVPPAAFRAQMQWLHRHRFHAVTQEQLFAALEHGVGLPRRPVLITFDDGYRDVLWNAAPVLTRLHMHATAYVITGRISGADSSFLTWGELRLLERLGIEIGSHTVHHVELPQLSDAAALKELVQSRRMLERHLGHPVQWFAYPAGAVDAHVLPLVREAGYVLAVTTQPGVEQSAADPFELHRYEILDTTGVAGLAGLLR
jgi:peptidoglycan/xylan/chitin deacetylase (PgdA/CDA1 family)